VKGVVSETLPFRSLKTQDLTQFRLAIERGDVHKVEEFLDTNPRYLIGSADTPVMLQV